MDDATIRCRLLAQASEPLPGTAPVSAWWLLVQDHGPWGRDALQDGSLPGAVIDHLTTQLATHDVRYQAIRRPDRRRRATRTVFLANVPAGWLARRELVVEDLVGLDLAPVSSPDPPPGWDPVPGPVVAVCTHGRRDACCAQWGRPLVLELARHGGGSVWETSHTSGHRFAPSVLTFPAGTAHGFVDDAQAWWRRAALGRLDLATYRGSVARQPAAQAAEVAVRRRWELDRPGDVVDVVVDLVGDDGRATVHHRRVEDGTTTTGVTLARHHLADGPTSCDGDDRARSTWRTDPT